MKKLKKITAIILSITLLITMSSSAIFAGTRDTEKGKAIYPSKDTTYSTGELIVVYKENVSSVNISRHMKNSVAKLQTLSSTQKMAVVKLKKGTDLKEAIAEYADSPIVDYVQPNYLYRLPAKVSSTKAAESIDKDWHFDSINMSGVKTRYNEVAETSGTKKVRVAVLDTGVDINHPDLQQCLNKDMSVKTNPEDSTFSPLTGDSDIFDGHGTHVCGIIGATANNGIGAKGIASYVLGNKLELIAVDIFDFYDNDEEYGNQDGVLDYEEYGADTADIVQGLDYARTIKADVINLSIGSYEEDKAEREAFARCIDDGIVVVSAAGNEGTALEMYPADYEGVISVIATDETGEATDWTNYGPTKDISAPGENIYSTIPATLTGYDEITGENTGKTVETSGYALMSGTSMASPVAAGVIAILNSLQKGANNLRLENAITKTATDIGPEGKDSFTGYGRLNAKEALKYIVKPAKPTSFKVTLSTNSKTASTNYRTVKLSWNKMLRATEYKIGYKIVGSKTYKYKTVPATKNTATLKLSGGKQYQFKVKACRKVSDRTYSSDYTSIKKIRTLKKVYLKKIERTSKGNLKLRWTNISGESGYQIQKKKGKNGKWYTVKWRAAKYSTFLDKKVSSKSKYYYKIRAYKTVKVDGKTKKVYGPWSEVRYK